MNAIAVTGSASPVYLQYISHPKKENHLIKACVCCWGTCIFTRWPRPIHGHAWVSRNNKSPSCSPRKLSEWIWGHLVRLTLHNGTRFIFLWPRFFFLFFSHFFPFCNPTTVVPVDIKAFSLRKAAVIFRPVCAAGWFSHPSGTALRRQEKGGEVWEASGGGRRGGGGGGGRRRRRRRRGRP